MTANAQDAYSYFAIGSSSATVPHTNELTLNGIVTAGAFYNIFDISINYEYVNLTPKYHSYFVGVQVRPIYYKGIEALMGVKYGRVIRDGTYLYAGVNGELRYGKKFFVSLVGSYDYRSDIHSMWDKDYFVYTTHLKVGIKI